MDQVQDPNQFIIDVAGTKEDPFLSIIMPDASTLRVEKNCESKILSGLPTLLNFQISADTQVAFNAWRDPQKRSGWPKKLTCNYPLFLEHWIRSLNYRQTHLNSHTAADPYLKDFVISKTHVLHGVQLHGETAHSLRHWVRGGNVAVGTENQAGVAVWNDWNKMLQILNIVSDAADWDVNGPIALKPGNTYMKTLGQNLPTDMETKIPFGHDIPSDFGTKILSSDLHHFQVPDGPIEFFKQLRAEARFPELIKLSDGYGPIEQEVKNRWRGLTGKNKTAEAKEEQADVIIWVRYVTGQEDWAKTAHAVRTVTQDEQDGFYEAASALAKEIADARGKKPVLIVLGDSGGWWRGSEDNVHTLLGEHLNVYKKEKGKQNEVERKRSQLEQLQYITAVATVTGAKIILGPRTGLVDKVSLCCGIACCQFIAANFSKSDNDRLDGVYYSGCGMGNNIRFLATYKKNNVKEAFLGAGQRAIARRDKLLEELIRLEKQLAPQSHKLTALKKD